MNYESVEAPSPTLRNADPWKICQVFNIVKCANLLAQVNVNTRVLNKNYSRVLLVVTPDSEVNMNPFLDFVERPCSAAAGSGADGPEQPLPIPRHATSLGGSDMSLDSIDRYTWTQPSMNPFIDSSFHSK